MLVQVDERVINTDQIKFIKKIRSGSGMYFLDIYFDKDFSESIRFSNAQDMERFLDKLGKREYFA